MTDADELLARPARCFKDVPAPGGLALACPCPDHREGSKGVLTRGGVAAHYMQAAARLALNDEDDEWDVVAGLLAHHLAVVARQHDGCRGLSRADVRLVGELLSSGLDRSSVAAVTQLIGQIGDASAAGGRLAAVSAVLAAA